MKILVLVPAPNGISPSQRFRLEQYINLKNREAFQFVEKSFFSQNTWKVLHKPDYVVKKITGILGGFIKRFLTLFSLFKYDFVFIHRETTPIGPPIFEWIIAKIFRKKIIYDFDDAIWVNIASDANPGVGSLKCTWKVKNICSYSHIVVVGNDFLASFARQYCNDVRVIPTVVNTDTTHNRLKNQQDLPLTIGWTGTFTTLYHLELIKRPLIELKKKYTFEVLIIGNMDPLITEFQYTYKQWSPDSEIDDLLKMNIGLMPLYNSEFELGKCAFKAIQYMSLGIPAVVSPVGANVAIVQENINGFWADSDQEWYDILEKLLTSESLRAKIGTAARQRIEDFYSVRATSHQFFDLFK